MSRFCTFLACAFLLIIAVAGCYDSNEGSRATAGVTSPTRITALIWAPDWSDEMQTIAREFTKLHPEIAVDIQFMIGDSVEANLKPKVAANNLPDIISVNPNAYSSDLADHGLLADLGKTTAWNEMLETLKDDWTSAKGQHFGISGGIAATLVYYNVDMFKKAGIQKIPINFDEFLKSCEKLKRAGFIPIILTGAFPNMLANGLFSSGFANSVVPNNPDWKQGIRNGKLSLSSKEGDEIFSHIKLLIEKGYVQPNYMQTSYNDGIKLFINDKAAMTLHGTWAAGMLMSGKAFEVNVFLPPWNKSGMPIIPVIGSETGFAVSQTGNKEAAFRFLDYFFGKGFPIYQNKRQNIPSIKEEALKGPIITNSLILKQIRAAQLLPLRASPYYSFLPTPSMDVLHTEIQGVLQGRITPHDAARRLDESIKKEARRNNL